MPAEPPVVADEELARLAQAGSLPAFEELVLRYEGRLFRFLAQGTRNESDAADLAQETLVAVYQNLERFNPARSFASWVFTIARRRQIDYFRARGRARETQEEEPIDEDDPARQLTREEERAKLWDCARATLGGAEYQALWLKYTEDLSVAEIAVVLGRTQVHVKVMLFRARGALAVALERLERAETAARNNAGATTNPPAARHPTATASENANPSSLCAW